MHGRAKVSYLFNIAVTAAETGSGQGYPIIAHDISALASVDICFPEIPMCRQPQQPSHVQEVVSSPD